MPVIRDPVQNKLQGRYGVVWCPDEKEKYEGVLAVYDKRENPNLQNLPTGWEIFGDIVECPPKKWCGISINRQLTNIEIGGPTGPASQLIGSHLRNYPILLNQDLTNPMRDDDGTDRIYPIDL